MRDKHILIMAGGTGGHIYPALAVADKLKQKGFILSWLGSGKGMESGLVPEHSYHLFEISVSGIRGKSFMRLLLAPLLLGYALLQSIHIMLKIRPMAVLGMGGYASGPGGIAAWLLRVPLLIHEQNAIVGLTNRYLAPIASCVMTAFPAAFHNKQGIKLTGNPIREDIVLIDAPDKRFVKRNANRFRILVLGGSLGAKRLNEIIPATVALMTDGKQIDIKHQCGTVNFEDTQKEYERHNVHAEVLPFITDMSEVYDWADVVICRAGALTIAELAVVGITSILVPFPYAVDDHQTENAKYLSEAGAAILIQERELSAERLASELSKLSESPTLIIEMACKARKLSKPDATEQVANLCAEIAYA